MNACKNILIVYSSGADAGAAAVRTLQVFGSAETQLHLVKLTIRKSWPAVLFSPFTKQVPADHSAAETDMELISREVNAVYPSYQLMPGNVKRKNFMAGLSNYCAGHDIDLILVAKERGRQVQLSESYAFYHRISRQTGIPVILFLNENDAYQVRSVLLPVTGFIPVKRIEIALEIAKQFHARIYIATIIDNAKTDIRERSDSFYQTFKTLSESGYAPFYKVFPGKHSVQTILQYGEQVKADLMVINPEKQSSFTELAKEKIAEWMHPLSLGCTFKMKPNIQSPA